jgi:hypothetical protein
MIPQMVSESKGWGVIEVEGADKNIFREGGR